LKREKTEIRTIKEDVGKGRGKRKIIDVSCEKEERSGETPSGRGDVIY
jgi:hypothetical protein